MSTETIYSPQPRIQYGTARVSNQVQNYYEISWSFLT